MGFRNRDQPQYLHRWYRHRKKCYDSSDYPLHRIRSDLGSNYPESWLLTERNSKPGDGRPAERSGCEIRQESRGSGLRPHQQRCERQLQFWKFADRKLFHLRGRTELPDEQRDIGKPYYPIPNFIKQQLLC